MNNFITRKEAAEKLNVSLATIDRRRTPWTERAVPFKLRYKLDVIQRPFIYAPDCEQLEVPPARPAGVRRAGRPRRLCQSANAGRVERRETLNLSLTR